MNTPTTERPNTYIFCCFGSLLAHVPFANPRVGWTNPRVVSTSVYSAEPHNSFFSKKKIFPEDMSSLEALYLSLGIFIWFSSHSLLLLRFWLKKKKKRTLSLSLYSSKWRAVSRTLFSASTRPSIKTGLALSPQSLLSGKPLPLILPRDCVQSPNPLRKRTLSRPRKIPRPSPNPRTRTTPISSSGPHCSIHSPAFLVA